MTGKDKKWIEKRKKMWRKYREKNGLDSDDEEELRRNIIALIPERKTQKNRTESKNKSGC